MTRSRQSLAVLAVALLALAGPAGAQEPSPSVSISLVPSSRPELADLLTARLTTPDGGPISEARIEFWIRSDLFGERYAFVGESPTDSAGVARLPFVPHQSRYDVRVTFDGDEVWGPAEAIAPIEFPTDHVITYTATDPSQLGSLRFVMPRIMGIVVGLVWAALLGLAFFTLRSFKRGGSEQVSHD